MLKLADLAARPDFDAGALLVSPSRRIVRGPHGEIHLEPRIMQVFLLLLDAGGRVVTRNEIFDQCWGGAMVGDDSLNRAIAGVRRIATEVAPGAFEVETIPRTGYRMIGDILEPGGDNGPQSTADTAKPGLSRRLAIAAGVSAAALGGAAGLWWLNQPVADPRVEALIARAEQAMREGYQIDEGGNVQHLDEAIRINPDNAKAWGLLALVRANAADDVSPDQSASIVRAAEAAAAKARSLNSKEPHALLALAFIESGMRGWATFDSKLRYILSIDRQNAYALTALVALTQAAGLNRESWALNERVLQLEPLNPTHIFRKAFKLWISGRVEESYRVIDRAFDLWPDHVGVWNARLIILAFTGRTEAAMAMLEEGPEKLGLPAAADMWRATLTALAERSATNVAVAQSACLGAAGSAPGLAAQSVMMLAGLGEVDSAFEVANGFLLSRGKVVMRRQAGPQNTWATNRGWKWTQWLFTPPVATMRADGRFLTLCDGIGLVEYWRARGVRPDYQLAKS